MKNICHNVSYAIKDFCLDNEQIYECVFQSPEICEKVLEDLEKLPKSNATVNVRDCSGRSRLQAMLNHDALKGVSTVYLHTQLPQII